MLRNIEIRSPILDKYQREMDSEGNDAVCSIWIMLIYNIATDISNRIHDIREHAFANKEYNKKVETKIGEGEID